MLSPPFTHQDQEGCYLLYHSDSGGRLELQYSKTPVEKAIGFWAAGEKKKIQGFKFNQNSGRQELIKGIAGGDSNKKKYYSGCSQFIKEAKKYNGRVTFYSPIEQGIEVDVYVYFNDGSRMENLDFQGGSIMYDVSNVDAVAVVPRLNDAYSGLKSMDITQFSNKGNLCGNATLL
ncbi:hypothetical protein ACHAW6_007840 [Cyclotella cf. meneghiniana]